MDWTFPIPELPEECRTSDLRALLKTVFIYPDEDVPRLAAADCLDEMGFSARARLIRVGCERARVEAADPFDKSLPGMIEEEHALLGFTVVDGNTRRDKASPFVRMSTDPDSPWAGWQVESSRAVLAMGGARAPRLIVERGFVDHFNGPLWWFLDGGKLRPSFAFPFTTYRFSDFVVGEYEHEALWPGDWPLPPIRSGKRGAFFEDAGPDAAGGTPGHERWMPFRLPWMLFQEMATPDRVVKNVRGYNRLLVDWDGDSSALYGRLSDVVKNHFRKLHVLPTEGQINPRKALTLLAPGETMVGQNQDRDKRVRDLLRFLDRARPMPDVTFPAVLECWSCDGSGVGYETTRMNSGARIEHPCYLCLGVGCRLPTRPQDKQTGWVWHGVSKQWMHVGTNDDNGFVEPPRWGAHHGQFWPDCPRTIRPDYSGSER